MVALKRGVYLLLEQGLLKESPTYIDHMALIASEMTSLATDAAQGPGQPVFEPASQHCQIGLASLCPSYLPGKWPKHWQCTPENQDQQKQGPTLCPNPDQQKP